MARQQELARRRADLDARRADLDRYEDELDDDYDDAEADYEDETVGRGYHAGGTSRSGAGALAYAAKFRHDKRVAELDEQRADLERNVEEQGRAQEEYERDLRAYEDRNS